MTLGEFIRETRLAIKPEPPSQRRVALDVGITSAYMSDIELGHRPYPSDDVLIRIGEAIGVRPAKLIKLRDQER